MGDQGGGKGRSDSSGRDSKRGSSSARGKNASNSKRGRGGPPNNRGGKSSRQGRGRGGKSAPGNRQQHAQVEKVRADSEHSRGRRSSGGSQKSLHRASSSSVSKDGAGQSRPPEVVPSVEKPRKMSALGNPLISPVNQVSRQQQQQMHHHQQVPGVHFEHDLANRFQQQVQVQQQQQQQQPVAESQQKKLEDDNEELKRKVEALELELKNEQVARSTKEQELQTLDKAFNILEATRTRLEEERESYRRGMVKSENEKKIFQSQLDQLKRNTGAKGKFPGDVGVAVSGNSVLEGKVKDLERTVANLENELVQKLDKETELSLRIIDLEVKEANEEYLKVRVENMEVDLDAKTREVSKKDEELARLREETRVLREGQRAAIEQAVLEKEQVIQTLIAQAQHLQRQYHDLGRKAMEELGAKDQHIKALDQKLVRMQQVCDTKDGSISELQAKVLQLQQQQLQLQQNTTRKQSEEDLISAKDKIISELCAQIETMKNQHKISPHFEASEIHERKMEPDHAKNDNNNHDSNGRVFKINKEDCHGGDNNNDEEGGEYEDDEDELEESAWLFSITREEQETISQQMEFQNNQIILIENIRTLPRILVNLAKTHLHGKQKSRIEFQLTKNKLGTKPFWKAAQDCLSQVCNNDILFILVITNSNAKDDVKLLERQFVSVLAQAYESSDEPGKVVLALQGWDEDQIGGENPTGDGHGMQYYDVISFQQWMLEEEDDDNEEEELEDDSV